jgi:hypothetical protein
MDVNSMDNMRYLKDEKHFMELAFRALKEHFKNKNELEQFYRSIKTNEDKNLFLKISSFYLYLVKNCSITHDIDGTVKGIEYITNTLKYIAIFSLIESLYQNNNYIDFFEFLMKKSNQIKFPISKEQLRSHYKNYKEQYGAIRKSVAFFKQIEALYDTCLKGKIKSRKGGWQLPAHSISKVDKEQGLTINGFAKFLYGIRSDFVHQANLVQEVSKGTVISFKKEYLCQMNMDELMYVFEKGLLKFFDANKKSASTTTCLTE